LKLGGKKVTVTGVCKGAGMIEPNMATMLAFLFTDAAIGAPLLRKTLKEAVDRSFNRITVDGDRSTNDTCLIFANGAAGNAPLKAGDAEYATFRDAVFEITHQLALMIAKDGEGATKFMTINVRGARSDKDADLAARAVANSFLVKTAWAGPGANWGRVMDSLGYSPAKVVEDKVSIRFNKLEAVRNGVAGRATREQLMDVIALKEFTVDIDLGLGRGEATVYTCNITEEYVRVNM
jgi:glutamate N-acetyltransferase/amino-acid N-acetyltransferase